MKDLQIRAARAEDAERVSALMSQLGYGVAANDLRDRLSSLGDRREVLVAETPRGILGWVALSLDEPFVEGLEAELEGLVVEEEARGCGIGTQLLGAAEDWARRHGCAKLRVHSNVVRERALDFYQRHGYTTIKSQHNLHKRL
jgi:GNAT superfamily N-acetyltransferase